MCPESIISSGPYMYVCHQSLTILKMQLGKCIQFFLCPNLRMNNKMYMDFIVDINLLFLVVKNETCYFAKTFEKNY